MNAKTFNSKTGQFTIEAEVCQGESLLSPDGTMKLVPCDHCMKLEWKRLNVVSFLCDDCARKWQKGELIDLDIP